MKRPSPDNLSRRSVLAGSLGLGVTALLGAPSRAAPGKGKRQKILVIGGGIGGLVAAIGLVKKGFGVEVHEQTRVLKEIGAGLTIPRNSMRTFDAIGIWPQVAAVSSGGGKGGGAYIHYQTREILTGSFGFDWDSRPTSPEQGGLAHRAHVHDILVKEFARIAPGKLFLGHHLDTFTQHARGVRARFANGDTAEGGLLIGCDGISSVCQRTMFGQNMPTTFTGVVAFRTLVPRTEQLQPYLTEGVSCKYVGPGAGLNRYGIAGGKILNCVALVKTDSWDQEGWTTPTTHEEFLSHFRDFHENAQQIIKQAPADNLFKYGLRDREPLPTWIKGRAVLLGDAAHPMLPYLARGATSAIEDAMVLIRAMDQYGDHADAFAAYEKDRLWRTIAYMRKSREQGDALNQAKPEDYPKLRPDTALMRDYDPVTAPI
jgi:salicylate hydroxylase